MRPMAKTVKLEDILAKGSVVFELSSTDKEGVLKELAGVLYANGLVADRDKALDVLLERERLGSTGIGDGLAIPHGRLPGLSGIVGAFGRSTQGVFFDAMDGEPVHLFFLLLAPEDSATLHLMALARVARLLKSHQFRGELLKSRSLEELYGKLTAEDAGQQG